MLQVGSRGIEVTKLQGDLNRILPGEIPQLKTDGAFGPRTKERLIKFQSRNGLKADGIAGPKTQAKLTQTSAAPGAPPAVGAPVLPGVNQPPNTGVKRFTTEMQRVFQENGKLSQWGDFLNDLESTAIPNWKNFLGTISRAEDARSLAAFWIELFEITKGARSQMPTAFAAVIKLDKDALVLFEALSAPTSKMGKFLKNLGSAANAVALFVTVVECVQQARRGDPGPIAAELYKFAMGKAVPWAGMIDGLGQLLDGVVPTQTRESSMLFKILRSIDPVGLGGIAVDSVTSIVTSGFEMAARGKVDVDILTNRLTPLVARMKQGPASLFVELGENSGDTLYELTQTDIDFQAMMRYSFMELKEWIETAGSNAPAGGVRRGTI